MRAEDITKVKEYNIQSRGEWYEELLSVVISQQKKLIVVQDKSRLQDLEKMAGHMGYALVKKV